MDGLFTVALILGASYCFASAVAVPVAGLAIWKGAGVALLALWAARRGEWLLAAVFALGAAGDALLVVATLQIGAIAFLLGHLVAVVLYLRKQRPGASWGWIALAPVIAAVAFALPAERGAAPGVALYGLGLGAMVATAAMSRFRLATLGAWLFVASDLLLFARMGPLAGSPLPTLLIWPLYFAGQALIAWGVARDRAP